MRGPMSTVLPKKCYIIIIIIFMYVIMFGHYRLEAIDDAWSLSFAWNFAQHVVTDPAFRSDITQIIFGKTHSLVYSIILNFVGWSRSYAHGVSLLLTIVSVFLWGKILSLLDWSKKHIFIFMFIALLLEPFLGAANLTRPEALCFLFLSAGLLSFMKRRFFVAVLLACFATETHPMGIISFVYYLAFALSDFSRSDWKRAFLWGVPASLLGVAYFFIINNASFSVILETVRWGRQFAPSPFGTFSEYFIHRAYHRHVPELILLLACFALFIKQKLYASQRFLSYALVLTLVASVLIKRSDYIYVIYYFPLFIMLMMSVAKFYRKETALAVFFVLLLVPQYLFLWWRQGGFDMDQYIAKIRRAVPENSIPIIGSSNNWFAFMQSGRFIDYGVVLSPEFVEKYDTLYVIEGYYPPYNADHRADAALDILRKHYTPKDYAVSFDHFGKMITVSLLERKRP